MRMFENSLFMLGKDLTSSYGVELSHDTQSMSLRIVTRLFSFCMNSSL